MKRECIITHIWKDVKEQLVYPLVGVGIVAGTILTLLYLIGGVFEVVSLILGIEKLDVIGIVLLSSLVVIVISGIVAYYKNLKERCEE